MSITASSQPEQRRSIVVKTAPADVDSVRAAKEPGKSRVDERDIKHQIIRAAQGKRCVGLKREAGKAACGQESAAQLVF